MAWSAMRIGVSMAGLALALAGCGKGGRQKAEDRKGGGATEAAPPRIWKAKEAWRTSTYLAGPVQIAPLADGGALVASTFEETVTVGGATFTSRGEEDVLVHRVGADGTLGPGVQLGGTGGDAIESLVAAGDGAYLAIRINDPITLAGTPFAPPPADPDVAFDVPTAIVVARLDREGTPTAAFEAAPRLNGTRIASFPGGDLALVGSAIGRDEFFGHTELARVGPDGTPRWKVRFDKIEGNEIVAASATELVMSVRADGRLGLWTIDAATGKVMRTHELAKPQDANDLGGLAAARRSGDLDVALGSTGGTAIVDGKEINGGHLHPFLFATGAKGMTYTPLPDLVAVPVGSGTVRDTPFFGMQAFHTGDDPALHRGIYLVAYGATPQLVPVYQYRYDNDDWEHAPKQVVLGEKLAGRIAFSGSAAWVAGTCSDEPPHEGCVVKIDLTSD